MPEREEILQEIKKFFNVRELVCSHTFAKYGENSWQFLDTKLLHTLLVIRRDILQTPMVINYSNAYQRGLRCNVCQLVREKTYKNSIYLSAHVLGKAFDASMKAMPASQARTLIKQKQHLLPYPIRMEANVNWLHVDVRDTHNNKAKVIEFYG